MHYIRLGTLLLLSTAMACANSTAEDGPAADTRPPLDEQAALPSADSATDPTLHRLEREAIALVHADGCATPEQCHAAPVGNRPCGGPRYYVAYCPLKTDSTALAAKLAELSRAEEQYNQRNGLVSTCEMRMPLPLTASGGVCRFR